MRIHQLLIAISWMLLVSPQAHAGYKMYLKILGINGPSGGESTDPGHEGWIDILSFSHGASLPKPLGSGGGSTGGVERVVFNLFTVTKKVDKSSPILWAKALSGQGQSYGTNNVITFECMSDDASPRLVFRIQMEGVRLLASSSSYSNTPVNSPSTYTNNGLTEELRLDFTKINWTAYSYDASGVQTVKLSYWDLLTNTGG